MKKIVLGLGLVLLGAFIQAGKPKLYLILNHKEYKLNDTTLLSGAAWMENPHWIICEGASVDGQLYGAKKNINKAIIDAIPLMVQFHTPEENFGRIKDELTQEFGDKFIIDIA